MPGGSAREVRYVAGLASVLILCVSAVAYPYQAEEVRDGGTINGFVKYGGIPPSPVQLAVTKDREVCGTAPVYDQSLVVGRDRGVANAVVIIADIARGESLKSEAAVQFDQKGCRYIPHVAVFPAGSTVVILNSDGILHNIHTESIANPVIDLAQPGFKKQIRVTIEIKNTVEIKKDDAATIQTNILSGVSYILIEPGKSTELIEAKKGERYPVIRSRRSTLSSLTARGPQLLDKLDGILDHVDDVLNDDNRKAFAAILDHLQKISSDVANHSDEIATNAGEALKSAADLFTTLDKSYSAPNGLKDQLSVALDKASVALGDFDKLVKGLNDTNRDLAGAVQDLRPGLRNFSQHTIGDVDALVAETRQFIAGLGRLASQLERDPQRLLFGDRREGYQPK